MTKISIARVIATLVLLSVAAVSMNGAPWPPDLVSPGNNQSASNPPTLCAKVPNDPDPGDTVSIRFEAWGGGEGNHASGWIPGNIGDTICWTDDTAWSQGGHSWQARAMDQYGTQSGASPDWGVNVPAPSGNDGGSGNNGDNGNGGNGGGDNGGSQEAKCSGKFYFAQPPPQPVGTNISIVVNDVSCTNGVEAIDVMVEGKTIFSLKDNGIVVWKTAGLPSGAYIVKIRVKDRKAGYIFSVTDNYDLTGSNGSTSSNPPDESSNPNNYFTTGDVINIGGDIYVIIKEGSAIQRRLVPNPETLDALGITRSMINNKGFSDDELRKIGRGSDIPDVNRDPQGFQTFKATFLPNLAPIVPNQNQSGGEQAGGSQSGGTQSGGVQGGSGSGICKIEQFAVNNVGIGVMGDCPNNVTHLRILVDGKEMAESAVSPLAISWNGIPYGTHLVRVEVKAGGEKWITAVYQEQTYTHTAPVPTNTPEPIAETSGNDPLAGIDCQQEGDDGQWWNPLNPSSVKGAEQCTQYVAKTVSEVEKCWGKGVWPNGGLWDDKARENAERCGWTVTNDFSKAKPGDIVTWNSASQNGGKRCLGANAEAGHVAVFQGMNSDGTIRVSEANWDRDHNKVPVDPTCMSVIHIPTTNPKPASETTQKPADYCSQYKKWSWAWIWCKLGGGK